MKYCAHCCTLFERGAICPDCKRELKKEIKHSDPVTVIRADGFERERIVAALRDNGVPCVEQFDKKERSADAVTGKLAAKVKIEVPFAALEQAKDILVGIGAVKLEGEKVLENESMPSGASDENSTKSFAYSHTPRQQDVTQKKTGKKKRKEKEPKPEPQWEEMSRTKRNVVRIVSAILFIIVVALVIFGTDFITGLVKELF